jgi:potassium voltage-gated channel Shaw-related subfamily C protein
MPILLHAELICNVFFTIEIIIRFLSSPNKSKFARNPYHFLEWLAVLPLFWPTNNFNLQFWGFKVHNFIQVFYVLRVLRIFTLVPKYSALRVLLLTLRHSFRELILYVVMLLMTVMFFGTLIFYAQQVYETENNQFDSIIVGLWYAVVTLTTLGYGDVTPSAPLGYIIGASCAITGLIFTALPIPVIVNNFTVFYNHAKATRQLKPFSESEAQKTLFLKAKTKNLFTTEEPEQSPQAVNRNLVPSPEEESLSSVEEHFDFSQEELGGNAIEKAKKRRRLTSDAKSWFYIFQLNTFNFLLILNIVF